jgi:hypothetical protein
MDRPRSFIAGSGIENLEPDPRLHKVRCHLAGLRHVDHGERRVDLSPPNLP